MTGRGRSQYRKGKAGGGQAAQRPKVGRGSYLNYLGIVFQEERTKMCKYADVRMCKLTNTEIG